MRAVLAKDRFQSAGSRAMTEAAYREGRLSMTEGYAASMAAQLAGRPAPSFGWQTDHGRMLSPGMTAVMAHLLGIPFQVLGPRGEMHLRQIRSRERSRN